MVPGRGSQVDNVEYDADSGDLYMGLISRVLDPIGLGGAIVARRAEDYRPSVALLQDTGVACVKPMRMLHSQHPTMPRPPRSGGRAVRCALLARGCMASRELVRQIRRLDFAWVRAMARARLARRRGPRGLRPAHATCSQRHRQRHARDVIAPC